MSNSGASPSVPSGCDAPAEHSVRETALPKSLRILIAEDEMFVAMDAEAILAAEGHHVVGVSPSAEDAVAKAGELKPDVVLMDIRLRGQRDGINAAAEIRRRFGLPVVFVTANADPITHARAMEVGPIALVSKPFNAESLRAALDPLTGGQ